MIDILLCSLITALLCNGLYISTSKGMLLYFIRQRLDMIFYVETIPIEDEENPGQLKEYDVYRKIYWPILYCVKCMPSIYGSGIAFLFLPFTPALAYQIPITILCSCCLSAVLYQLYE